MPVKINSYGGYGIWFFRRYYSQYTSKFILTSVEKIRRKKINNYITRFCQSDRIPDFKFIMLETVNRCNGKCHFCPANIYDEARPYKKMPDELIDKIIMDLKVHNWKGTFFPQVNNEPFIDKRLPDILRKIHRELPDVKICIISNGTLLDIKKLQEIAPYVSDLTINDYSEKYWLSKNCRELYLYVKRHKEEFKNINIVIKRRYDGEILATRAGNAPNKTRKNNSVSSPCIYLFTDIIIFPDGKVGMCCNDCKETTFMGDANTTSIFDIWGGQKFVQLRTAMRNGRTAIPFCRECDVIDAGSREKVIESE